MTEHFPLLGRFRTGSNLGWIFAEPGPRSKFDGMESFVQVRQNVA